MGNFRSFSRGKGKRGKSQRDPQSLPLPTPSIPVFLRPNGVVLPARCQVCGTWFPSGFMIGFGSTAGMVGNTSGPCPVCGGMGRIPDGVYNFEKLVEQVVPQLSGPEIASLHTSVGNSKQPSQVVDALDKDPRWRAVVEYLRPKTGAEIAAYVALLYAVLERHLGI